MTSALDAGSMMPRFAAPRRMRSRCSSDCDAFHILTITWRWPSAKPIAQPSAFALAAIFLRVFAAASLSFCHCANAQNTAPPPDCILRRCLFLLRRQSNAVRFCDAPDASPFLVRLRRAPHGGNDVSLAFRPAFRPARCSIPGATTPAFPSCGLPVFLPLRQCPEHDPAS